MYPTKDEIRQRVEESFRAEGYTLVGTPGVPETLLANRLTNEFYLMYKEHERKMRAIDPSKAIGVELDVYGNAHGIPRMSAQVAIDITRTNVYFYLLEGAATPITIPTGSRIFTNNGITYTTTEDVTITSATYANRQYVGVQAAGEGEAYNVTANALTNHNQNNANLRCGNHLPIETGSTLETDENYRKRILQYEAINRGANYPTLEANLRALPNVADITIVNHKYGIGTMGIFVESTNPITGPALLAQVRAEAEATVAAGIRPILEWPEHLFFACEPEVYLESGITLDSVRPAVQQAVADYVNGLRRGETLIFNQLTNAILDIPGIIDVGYKSVTRGIYDISTMSATNVQTIPQSNLPAGPLQKWVTAREASDVCEATNE
jgi:uncharacterized phage protein gp47/JayE